MKRYFDIHDQRITAELTIGIGTPAAHAPTEAFRAYFKSEDVREITLSEYRRLSEQYENGGNGRVFDIGDVVFDLNTGVCGIVEKFYTPTACAEQTVIKISNGKRYHAPTREFALLTK